MKKLCVLCSILLILSACGVRGKLYHPGEEPAKKSVFK
jgi:hypothetical protein